MGTATNIDATAVNTIAWLSEAETTIVVPVYQRQYRWDIGACEQLLGDIRAVADTDDRRMHFIGSILSSITTDSAPDAATERVLIDGQQRITTLMLLIAALHHSVLNDPALSADPVLAASLERVLVREGPAGDSARTTLRPHLAWAEVFENVILDRASADDPLGDSRFDDNYAFFRSQIPASEATRIWRGLQRLEHVAITLGPDANAQQIFESLNSTGEPLRDHELIHNYVLMGLSHAEQTEIENDFWLPIELNTGESIASFWRHYLVMTTGREIDDAGRSGRSVYDAFRQRFPHLTLETLREHAAEWREYSTIYRVLLEPTLAPDAAIARQLAYVNTFGRGMYPLVMSAYREYEAERSDSASLIAILELVQSLVLRRTIVALSNDRLVGRLCRAARFDNPALTSAIARVTPSDERVRVALKFRELPHAAYVLGRLADVADPSVSFAPSPGVPVVKDSPSQREHLDLQHVFPLAPADTWSGDGIRPWRDYSDDEQNSHRGLAQTLGNLTLLEPSLAELAFDASFPDARGVYAASAVSLNRSLAAVPVWGTAAIADRTAALTADFVRIWARPAVASIDDDGLAPILDAVHRRGWPPGWEREFEYVEFRGEHWDVFDMKYLFNRIFKRLWADSRESVVAFSERRGGPVFEAQAWNGHWDSLDDTHFIYMGWDSKYMLDAVQGVLDEAGIAPEVFVKYSYIGAAM